MALAVLGASAAWADPSEETPGGGANADYALGKKAVEAKDWPRAIELLSRAEVQDDRNADLENFLGFAYRNAGRLDEAFRHYERALQLNPRHRGAHEYIGEAYLMVHDLRRAEAHLAALKQICVVACEEADDLEKAIAAYRTRRSTSGAVSPASAPPGTEALAVEWVNVTAPGGGTMLAAVARPRGPGPFPAVVILHGTHGFAQEYVRLARDLASRGVLAVAACWFRGSSGAGARFVTPIGCAEAPALVGAVSAEAWQRVDALVQATRGLPGVRRDRLALFGHSRGAGAALNYSLGGGPVQAAVLNSSGYPPTFSELAARTKAPILMLHGTADSPADGGSELTNVRMARDFEAALRAAGKPVESMYYEGGRHNGLFSDPSQYQDEITRIVAFLARHLGP